MRTLDLIVIKHFLMNLSLCFTVSYYSQKNGLLYFLDVYTTGIMKTKIYWADKQIYVFIIFFGHVFWTGEWPCYLFLQNKNHHFCCIWCGNFCQLYGESGTYLCCVKLFMICRIHFQEKCCHYRETKCHLLLRKHNKHNKKWSMFPFSS